MAPFDQLFSHSILHPTHLTLSPQHHGLHSLANTIRDPYYNSNIQPFVKHHNVFSPLFDVRETDDAYFLEGEFPGVAAKEDIMIQELGPRTLLVETKQEHYDIEQGWKEFFPRSGAKNGLDLIAVNEKLGEHEEHKQKKHEHKENAEEGAIKKLAIERQVGTSQRSFTFPTPVDIGGLKARLRHGLLIMMVPKVRDGKSDVKRIAIED